MIETAEVEQRERDPASFSADDPDTVAERLRRLELSISRLENTDVLEKVLTQRVLERVQESAPEGYAPAIPAAAYESANSTALAIVGMNGAPNIGGIWSRIPILAEFRLMFLMYFDHRYRLSRFCQLAVPSIVALGVMNYFLFNWFFAIPLLGLILERVFLVVLAVVLFKILSREAVRYAAVLNYLARYGHS